MINALLVDDDEKFLYVTKRFLAREDPTIQVSMVTTASEALSKLSRENFDVIVSDYDMPDINGLELLEGMRQESNFIPFIMFTGKSREELAITALNLGANYYLAKDGESTTQFSELAHIIRQVSAYYHTEQALREERLRAQNFLDIASVMIVAISGNETATLINRKGCTILGYSEEEIIGKNWFDNFLPDSFKEKARQAFSELIAGKVEPSEYSESPIISKSGSERLIAWHNAVLTENGQTTGILSSGEDITERKRAEARLRASEETTRALLNAPTEAAILFDLDGTFQAINYPAAQRFGLSPEELIGRSVSEFVSPSVWETRKAQMNKVAQTGKPVRFEDTREGIVFDNHIYPSLDANGDVEKLAVFARDITREKQAEMALQENQERLQGFMDSATEGFALLDPDLRYLEVNQATLQFWPPGTKKEDLIGKSVEELLPNFKDSERYHAYLEVIRTGEPFIADDLVPHPTFGDRFLNVRAFKVGSNLGIIGSDITARKQAEQALKESEERFRTSVETMLDCFGIYSAIRDESDQIIDFRIEHVNAAACDNNQMTKEEQVGKKLCEILPAHRETGLFDEYCEVVETGHPLEKETLIYEDTYAGQKLIRAFDIRISKMGDGFTAAWRDVTNRKQAEEEVHESEERLQSFMDSSTEGFGLFDSELNYLEVNQAAMRFWPPGTKKEDLIGKSLGELLPNFKDSERYHAYLEVIRTGEPFIAEDLVPHPTFGDRILNVRAFKVGSNLGMIVLDVTENKQMEKKLKESNKRYQELVENIRDGMAIADTEGLITFANRKLGQMLGHKEEEMLGKHWSSFVHPKSLAKVEREIAKRLEGVSSSYKAHLLGNAGQPIPVIGNANPLFTDSGAVKGSVATFADISELEETEEAFQESEELHRTILENISDAVFITDDSGDFTYICGNVEVLFGYTAKEIQAFGNISNLLGGSLFTPEDLMAKRELSNIEWEITDKFGRIHPLFVNVKQVNIKGGTILYSCRDVTERKQAEVTLQESEERFRALFENANDAIFLSKLNRDGSTSNFQEVNQIACQRLGYTREELLALSIKDINGCIQNPAILEFIKKTVEQLRTTGKIAFETVHMTKDGQQVPTEINSSLLTLGGEIFALSIARDITERKKAEESIRQQSEFLKTIIDSLAHPFYVIDPNNYEVVLANAIAQSNQEESVAFCYALTHGHHEPCGEDNQHCPLPEVLRTKKPVVVEHHHIDNEGKSCIYEVHGHPVLDVDGNVDQMIEYILNITERKQVEEQLKQQREELSQFAHVMAHDLRNGFATIQSLSWLLLGEYNQEDVEVILNTTKRMNALLRRSVVLADAGRAIEKTDRISLDELIKTSAKTVIPDNIAFHCDALPTVLCDRLKIAQIFQNLFENAVIHGQPNAIDVRYQESDTATEILISNDGIPIPASHCPKIFQPGFSPQKKGTGLGLATVKKLVEAHGWQISLEIAPKTTFRLCIPD
ncbi:MAG: PAS domain S-box protein [Candidatus Heimdallarchaeota archaeon]